MITKTPSDLERESLCGIVAGYDFRIYWPKYVTPFDPEDDTVEVVVTGEKNSDYWTNTATMQFLIRMFKKNQETGECSSGTYFCMPGLIIVRKLDIPVIGKTLESLISKFGLDSLHSWNLFDIPDEKEGSSLPYEEFCKVHKKRFGNYEFEVDYPEDFDPMKGRVTVRLTTQDGRQYQSNFVSMGYLDQAFEEHREGKETIDREGREFYSGIAIYIPYLVVMEEITEENITKAINDMIENLEIDKHFKLI